MAKLLDETALPTLCSAIKQDLSTKANSNDLASVATSGSYNDLSNKPTTEVWTFTMSDGTTITKEVCIK